MGLDSSTSLQPSAPPISLSLAPYSTLLLDEAIRVGGGGTPTSLLEQVCEGSSRAPPAHYHSVCGQQKQWVQESSRELSLGWGAEWSDCGQGARESSPKSLCGRGLL